jgi:tight adherence protein B
MKTYLEYNKIKLTIKEKIISFLIAGIFISIVTYIFYRIYALSLISSLLAFFYLPFALKNKIKKIKNELLFQFKSFLEYLSTNISAGKSFESSLPVIKKELVFIFGENSLIDNEIEYMIKKLDFNENLTDIFNDFAQRADIDDIKNFATVLSVFQKTGGNFTDILKNTCNIINDKIEIKQEIEIHIAQKKLESRIMGIMPFIIILILSLSTGDFISPVFNTIGGRIVMTIALLIIITGNYIAHKITDISI